MRAQKLLSYVLVTGTLLILSTMAEAQRVSPSLIKGAMAEMRTSSGSSNKVEIVKNPSSDIATTDKKAIIGSWLETVTFPEPMPAIKSLSTFGGDGTLVVGDQGAVTEETAFTPGHGSWIHEYGRTFSWTSVGIIYSHADGSLIGYLKVSGRYTVDGTGNAYSGNFHADILDPDGNVLFSVEGTNAGTRIPVEVLP